MVVIYLIYSLIISLLILLMSLCYVLTFWWLLFIPRTKRNAIFYPLVTVPWVFYVNRLMLFTRLKILGKKHRVKKKETAVYICNHQSWLDVPILVRYSKAMALSKQEVRALPLVGLLIIYSGLAVFVDRNTRSSRLGIVKEISGLLKGGHSLFFFPEGTRSPDGRLMKPNNAIIKICYKNNIPVIPSAIEGTRDILPKKRIYLKFFRKVILEFVEPVRPQDYDNAEDFANECWKRVIDTHQKLLKNHFPHRLEELKEKSKLPN